jgi:zinc protease
VNPYNEHDRLPRFPVMRARLANGLRIVMQPDARWPLVASAMCYDAGSRIDPLARSGLAHLCEHLAGEGAAGQSGPSLLERVEILGGSGQGVTTTDRLCFSAVFPRRALDAVLAIEAERMARPVTPGGGSLDVQRRVLLDELRQRSQRRPRATAVEDIHRRLYPEGHPYHRPPAGEADGIRAISADDVDAFVGAHLTPARAVLVLAGDLSVSHTVALAARTFDSPSTRNWRQTSIAPEQTPRTPQAAMPSLRGPAYVPAPVPAAQAHVAWSVPGFCSSGWHLAALLVRALAVGHSSPLARALIDRQRVAREVHGSLVTMRDSSTLVFAASAAPGIQVQQLERALFDTIDELLAGGLSGANLARARRRALSDHYLATETLERRADLCAVFACYLDVPEQLERHPRGYLDADLAAVAGFASALGRDTSRAQLTLIPTEAA